MARLATGWVDEKSQRHRILIPEIAVEEAERAGVPLAYACVLLDVESSGGQNVFGPIPGSGCGQPRGSEVTEESYAAYLRDRERCGGQGAGVLQLTWPPLQDMATEAGGVWRPEINMRIGLGEFVRLLNSNTVRDAYSRWRYGRPEADVNDPEYVERAMTLLPGWQRVIDG